MRLQQRRKGRVEEDQIEILNFVTQDTIMVIHGPFKNF